MAAAGYNARAIPEGFMTVQTFIKKPSSIQALQWTGENWDDFHGFVPPGHRNSGTYRAPSVGIRLPSGWNRVDPGDWIAKRADDDFYVIKADLFGRLYEPGPEFSAENSAEASITQIMAAMVGDAVKAKLDAIIPSQRDYGDETPEQSAVRAEMAHDNPEFTFLEEEDEAATMARDGEVGFAFVKRGHGLGPVEVNERATQLMLTICGREQLSFSAALVAMKAGHRVARAGWNGKGMWICLGSGQDLQPRQFWNEHTRRFAEGLDRKGLLTPVLPYFIMKTADDAILMGWLASQSDLVAADWQILHD